MWKKYQSRFSADFIVEAQRAKDIFQTTIGPNQIDVRGEDNVIYRTHVNHDLLYGNSPGNKYWLVRKGDGLTPMLWSDEYVTNNWQVYLEPLPTGVTTPVPLSASKAWREYYHKGNPKQRVVVQDIYKISLVGESNTYRVEGVDGVVYNALNTLSGDDYNLEHCKLVKTTHNGKSYYSLLPGSSFATFYHPVDGDPQPVEMPPIQDGDLKPLNIDPEKPQPIPVEQTQQFVTIFSAALSALISSNRFGRDYNDIVDHAYRIAKLSTEKLCGPQ